ncbi:MAG: CDP-alcohol phosphatidyltransferase family protein [Cystobacterineae bacterium]|nr:CDP-alcohol phosphatidyltransferase family protein [Cystobacterineae bacterium]
MWQTFMAWLSGDLSQDARIWTALAPAVLAAAYFIIGLVVFSIRCLFVGILKDSETEKRGASVLVGMFLRHYFFWVIYPLSWLVLRSGLPANAITTLSALIGMGSGVAVAAGRFALGGWLFLFAGILDTLDGRLARMRKTASLEGAVLDSILDRYVDGAFLVGLAWYYRDTWVLFPVLAALLGTSLVPYVRAKGEGLGVELRGGVMQRLERVLFLGGGVALAPVLEAIYNPDLARPPHMLAIAGIIFVAIFSNITAITRLRDLLLALAPKSAFLSKKNFPHWYIWGTVTAAIATAVDFFSVFGAVELLAFNPVWATAMGCCFGAAVNFSLNRWIVFRSKDFLVAQLNRYIFTSAMSAALNAFGLYLILLLPNASYLFAWWLVRLLVFLSWNLPTQKNYVFVPRQPTTQPTTECSSGCV